MLRPKYCSEAKIVPVKEMKPLTIGSPMRLLFVMLQTFGDMQSTVDLNNQRYEIDGF